MATLQELVERAYDRYATLPAVSDDAGTSSYAELDSLVARARGLLWGMGVRPGDRIGIVGTNSVDYMLVDHACFTGGFVRVGINRRSTIAEVVRVVEDAGLTVLFADAEWRPRLGEPSVLPSSVRVIALGADADGSSLRARLSEQEEDRTATPVPPDAPATLIYTSGTTGIPKAITVTQANLAGTVRNVLIEIPMSPGSAVLHPIPLSHAAMQLSVAFLCRGAFQSFAPTTDPGDILDLVADGHIAVLSAVPTLVGMLARAQCDDPRDLSSLRAIVYGGSTISANDLRAAVSAFGPTLYQMYAQSESSLPLTCLNPLDHLRAAAGDERIIGSAGRPGPFVGLAIVDEAGRRLRAGGTGEVVVRGDTVMAGYRGDPEATATVLGPDGWLRTGDVGYLTDDGYLVIVDRLKDMIISGGFNVFPSEVEAVLCPVPGVQEVAVYGVPDEKWGERVCVAVVADEHVTLDALQQAGRATLSGYKLPREMRRYDSLPLNATGKVLRRILQEWHGA